MPMVMSDAAQRRALKAREEHVEYHASLVCRHAHGTDEHLRSVDDDAEAAQIRLIIDLVHQLQISLSGLSVASFDPKLLEALANAAHLLKAYDEQENAHHAGALDANAACRRHAGILAQSSCLAADALETRGRGVDKAFDAYDKQRVLFQEV